MVIRQKLERWNRLFIVVLLAFALFIPLLTRQNKASAYGLLASRVITMSSSAQGGIAAGQNVTYHVRFNIATAGNTGSIAIDFCDNTPIIGDTSCGAIAGFNIGTPTVSGQSDGVGTDPVDTSVNDTCNLTAFTTATALTTHTLSLVATAAQNLSSGATCFFDITTVTNPTTVNHTFFARIYTYSGINDGGNGCTTADVYSGCYTAADPVTFTDAGGIALSTAEQITITAKVPEKLTFCVYTSASSNNCTAVSGNAITLGDNHGVLSDIEEFVNADAKYSIATNALNGVAIRVKGGTLKTNPGCSEATGQNCSIDAIGAAAAANASGTEQFGFCTYSSAGTGLTPASPYNNASCNTVTPNAGNAGNATAGDAANSAQFAFDNNNTTGTTSTYGQIFANKTAGTFSTGILAFVGNITTTTEPGIYTTTLTFIATGTY